MHELLEGRAQITSVAYSRTVYMKRKEKTLPRPDRRTKSRSTAVPDVPARQRDRNVETNKSQLVAIPVARVSDDNLVLA